MPLVVLPHSLVDGVDTALGSDVLGNDQAIANAVNALDDANIKVGAAINGSKLSNVAGARVPADRIEDNAATTAKVQSDAVVDGNRAITTNHIRDVAVTAPKLGTQSVIAAKIKVSTFDWTPGGSLTTGQVDSVSTGVLAANVVPLGIQQTFAGAPGASTTNIIAQLLLNTVSGNYHIMVVNVSTGTQSRVGITYRFSYVPLA